jgi:hypothetical protein
VPDVVRTSFVPTHDADPLEADSLAGAYGALFAAEAQGAYGRYVVSRTRSAAVAAVCSPTARMTSGRSRSLSRCSSVARFLR